MVSTFTTFELNLKALLGRKSVFKLQMWDVGSKQAIFPMQNNYRYILMHHTHINQAKLYLRSDCAYEYECLRSQSWRHVFCSFPSLTSFLERRSSPQRLWNMSAGWYKQTGKKKGKKERIPKSSSGDENHPKVSQIERRSVDDHPHKRHEVHRQGGLPGKQILKTRTTKKTTINISLGYEVRGSEGNARAECW